MRQQTLDRLLNKVDQVYYNREKVWSAIINRLETESATCGSLCNRQAGPDQPSYCILGILQEALVDAGLIRPTMCRIRNRRTNDVEWADVLPDYNRLTAKESALVRNQVPYPFQILLPALGLGHWMKAKPFLANDNAVAEFSYRNRVRRDIHSRPIIENPLECLQPWKDLHEEVRLLQAGADGGDYWFEPSAQGLALKAFFRSLQFAKSIPEKVIQLEFVSPFAGEPA